MIELCANPDEVDEEKLVAEQQIMEERYFTEAVSFHMLFLIS